MNSFLNIIASVLPICLSIVSFVHQTILLRRLHKKDTTSKHKIWPVIFEFLTEEIEPEELESEKRKKEETDLFKLQNKIIQNTYIIDDYYKERNDQLNVSLAVISFGVVSYWVPHLILNKEPQMEVLFFLCTCAFLVCIAKFLIYFRIKNDYYGTNYEEAKELLYYLMKSNDKNNRNSGKKIFNEEKKYTDLRVNSKSPLINKS